ncbi:hypothetical protein ACFQ2B_32230 [Streptomyces stramineus]
MTTERTTVPPGIFTPEFFQNAHPVLDDLREQAPATLVTGVSGTRLWLVPRYEEARGSSLPPRSARTSGSVPTCGNSRPPGRTGAGRRTPASGPT